MAVMLAVHVRDARLKHDSTEEGASERQVGSELTPYCDPVAVSLGSKRRPYSGGTWIIVH